MKHKLFLLLALTVIFSMLMTACTTGQESTSTPTRPAATNTEPAAVKTEDAVATEETEATEEGTETEATEEAAATEEGTETEATEEGTETEGTEEAAATDEVGVSGAATQSATDSVAGPEVATEEATEEGTETEATEEAGNTIADLAMTDESLSTLLAAVTVADASVLEMLEDNDAQYTVFAPNNDAFTAALEEMGVDAGTLLADQENLTNILSYHVVEGVYTTEDLEDGMELTTLQGGTLVISVDGDEVTVNGAPVVTADVTASNGVVHIIDGVLMPAGEEAGATEEATEEGVETEATEEMAMTEEAEPTEVAMATEEMEATEEMVMTEEPEMAETEEMAMTEEPEMVETEEGTEAGTTEETVDLTGTIDSVCLVTDLGRINDGSFNQSAYEGMVNAVRDFNIDSTFIETQNQADYAANIDTCLADGYDAVVTVGFLIADATYAAAEANPETYFIGVDQGYASPLPNLVGIQFREDQSGFLAGVMAGLMTESNVVGGVYGPDIPPVLKFRNGFENGVKFVNPDAEILRVHIGDFLAAAEGAEAAENFIGEGADVIFGAGGPTGSGAIRRAAEQGVKVIGVDQDEYFTTFGAGETPGSENIISSAVKRVDVGVYQMLQALSEGGIGWPVDSSYVMDAAVEGVGFAPANEADVPAEVTDRLNEILEQMSAGELNTGVDPLSGELLEGEAPEGSEGGEAEATEEATPES